MGSIAFLQPLFLMGLLGAAVPVIIHLINRQRRRRLPFSAVRFLVQTDRRSARKYRLVDLIVLMLRVLLLALVALALAQPVLRPRGAEEIAFGRVSLVIVLDDTLSMRATTDGVSAFDRARDAAATIVSEMPQDGEAFVVLLSGRKPASLSTAASPPSLIAEALSDLEASSSARSLPQGISIALDHLAGSKPKHKALVIISDNQKSTIGPLDAIDHERIGRIVRSFHWLDVGEQSSNLAVTALRPSPRVCFPGTPVRFSARIYNGSPEAQIARASFWVDDMQLSDAALDIHPGSSSDVTFDYIPQASGTRAVEVRIEPDGLDIDNARFEKLRVLQTVSALLIVPDGEEGRAESLYLETALNPLASPNYSGRSPVQMRKETYNTADIVAMDAYQIVLVVDNGNMPRAIFSKINRYTNSGGTGVFFPGRQWMQLAESRRDLTNRKLANIPLFDLWKKQPGESSAGIGQYDASHPILHLLATAAPQLFGLVTVESYLQINERALNPYSNVIARLSTGDPLLIDARNHRGRLIIWTLGPHPDWSDLPYRPLFLPLLYETMKFASDTDSIRQEPATIDEGIVLSLPAQTADRRYTVETPTGQRESTLLAARATELRFDENLRAGHYTIYPTDNIQQSHIVPVNIAASESEADRVKTESLAEKYDAPPQLMNAASSREIARRLTNASRGVNLTGYLLALALIVFLTESFLSNFFLRFGQPDPEKNRQTVRRIFHRFRSVDTEGA